MKDLVDEILRMCNGREFHCLAAQKENDLSPKVLVRVLGTQRIRVSAEERS